MATLSNYVENTTTSSSWEEGQEYQEGQEYEEDQEEQELEQEQKEQEEGLQESAERVSSLFSSTIKNLAADVEALKHLTTWKDILDEENEEEDVDRDGRRGEILESLVDLDDVVSAVEKKVNILREIVAEEQQALENLNLLRQDSMEQNETLQHLVDRIRKMKVTTSTTTSSNKPLLADPHHYHGHHQAKASNNNNNNTTANGRRSSSKKTTTAAAASSSSSSAKRGSSIKKVTNYPRGSLRTTSSITSGGSYETHTHVEGLSCFFDQVTVEELESVPRTTRGRVQVHVINEALDNIESCFHKKALKERKKMLLLEESRHVALARYHKDGNPEDQIDNEALLQNLVVTEQELRQSCAFFAAGEGTARTVLAVLKALRRIKQVPQRKGGAGFLYRLCLD